MDFYFASTFWIKNMFAKKQFPFSFSFPHHMEVALICTIMKSWGKQYLDTIMKQTDTSEMLIDTYSNFLKSSYLVINLIFLQQF